MEIKFEKIENPEFSFYKLNELGVEKSKLIKDIFNDALNKINCICPPSRELSIVKTKLEEACFFAKKSIAKSSVYQYLGE